MFEFFFPELHHKLDLILHTMRRIMPTLDELGAEMRKLRTLAEGNKALIQGLEKQIADANLNLTAEEQAKVDAIFADAVGASAALTREQVANTPAANVDPNAPGV